MMRRNSPKTTFVGKISVESAANEAVLVFNEGKESRLRARSVRNNTEQVSRQMGKPGGQIKIRTRSQGGIGPLSRKPRPPKELKHRNLTNTIPLT